ncbi:hypothetical protein B4923_15465 [Brenneria roseae subsp. americana]|uniref:Uncharacterized protein n=1 Tax=Brenneria roseae subsp. americana TaxID=1508507 RepID=A0A2U1TNC9_9GAMM|nr:hypothetical protein [Brenneria roseae]PWC10908.1 hypothetical protein B4923_15465 [Brenneria roseae subsp. americana]
MNKQPTEHEIHFRIWYSYWLERMTETLNRRIDMFTNAIILTLGAAIFATSHFSWLFGGIIAVLSGFRIAWQYGKKAEAAKQQAKRYASLIDNLPGITIDEIREKLKMLEEFDSVALNSLCNPARNGASISLRLKYREPLSFIEKAVSLLAGSTPR